MTAAVCRSLQKLDIEAGIMHLNDQFVQEVMTEMTVRQCELHGNLDNLRRSYVEPDVPESPEHISPYLASEGDVSPCYSSSEEDLTLLNEVIQEDLLKSGGELSPISQYGALLYPTEAYHQHDSPMWSAASDLHRYPVCHHGNHGAFYPDEEADLHFPSPYSPDGIRACKESPYSHIDPPRNIPEWSGLGMVDRIKSEPDHGVFEACSPAFTEDPAERFGCVRQDSLESGGKVQYDELSSTSEDSFIIDQKPARRNQRRQLQRRRNANSDKSGRKTPQLWQFLWEILDDPRYNPELIKWIDIENGIFKFVQSQKVAKLWGQSRQRQNMSYEYLSRGLRHYYKRGLMKRIGGKRLVYQFGPKARSMKRYPQA